VGSERSNDDQGATGEDQAYDPSPMKTLTIQQPWAWAIIHGGKDVENRPQNCRFRGRFYVHAGLKLSDDGLEWMEQDLGIRGPVEFQHGVITGTVELYGVVRDSDSPWATPGCYHWLLRDPRPLARPMPARGRQGWWEYTRRA
jgi:hypothetical protein